MIHRVEVPKYTKIYEDMTKNDQSCKQINEFKAVFMLSSIRDNFYMLPNYLRPLKNRDNTQNVQEIV